MDSFTCRHLVWPSPYVEDAVFIPVCVSVLLLNKKNQMSMAVCAYILVFNLSPLITMSVFLPVHVVFITIALSYLQHFFIIHNCCNFPVLCVCVCVSMWSWKLFFWNLWRIVLEFLWGFHWICRMVRWLFFQMIFFYFYVHWYFTCMHVCVKVSDLLELEFQAVVSCHVDARN